MSDLTRPITRFLKHQTVINKRKICYSSCYDKELLIQQDILLDHNSKTYQIIDKLDVRHFRAQLSGYFEVEICIFGNDFEKADKL